MKSKREALYKKIKALPCFALDEIETLVITNIEAGQSSQCFDVSIQGIKSKRYFVKFNADSVTFKNEVEASNYASDIKLSPQVFYSDKNWMVNEFIQAKSLDKLEASVKSKIELSVKLIQQCHTLGAKLPQLNLPVIVTDIINTERFSASQKEHVMHIVSNIPSFSETAENELVLCHSDVNFSNVLFKHNQAWLIDFECACLADKEFELAMFMAINFLTIEEQTYTVNCYENLNNVTSSKLDKDKLAVYLTYSYLINGLWYFDKANEKHCKPKELFYTLSIKQLKLFDKMYSEESLIHTLF